MNYADWYTDTMDIYRVVPTTTNGLTKHTRTLIVSGIPCRIYQTSHKDIYMQQTAASDSSSNMIACDNSVNVQIGDEIIAHRGAGLGQTVADERAFVSDINYYFEPFGAVMPGLAHMEIALYKKERA